MIKVYMLPAGKGDFFIIQFEDCSGEHFIFIDGGDKSATLIYLDALKKMKKNNKQIDAMIFSHNDDDHICGALYAFMALDQLPVINKIYFNLGENIHRRLNVNSNIKYPEKKEKYNKLSDGLHSTKHAISLLELLKQKQLYDKIQDCVCQGDIIKVGNAKIKIISPGKKELKNYLDKWDQESVNTDIYHAKNERETFKPLSYYADQKIVYDTSVTNGSSIAFILELDNHKLAFLGDAYPIVCFNGLKLFYDQSINVDVIKIPHHGSEHNYSNDLYKALSTNNYLLSTKGDEKHPSPVFLGKLLGENPNAKIWCNSNWMKYFPFAEEDSKKYLNNYDPQIVNLKETALSDGKIILNSKFEIVGNT